MLNCNCKVLAPKLAEMLSKKNLVNFIPLEPMKFFESVTNSIIERRKANLDKRGDFIQSMIEREEDKTESKSGRDVNENKERSTAWNGKLKNTLTNGEILSQAIIFFAAGYETTATTLEYISYNLATHQDAQDILIDEIDQVLDKHVRLFLMYTNIFY